MGTTADTVAIALRALGFAAALQAAGAAIFLAVFSVELRRSAHAIARATVRVAVVALLATAAAQVAAPVRLVGGLDGVFDGALQAVMLESDTGTVTAVRLFGLALVLWGARGRDRHGAVGLVGASLVAASFALMGHTAAGEHRWLAAPLLIAHLLIVAFWFGTLVPLRLAGRHEDLGATARLVARFSALAAKLVPAIFVAGLALAALLLPGWSALASPYGKLLLLKVTGFALLMGLAALNRWRFGPRIARGDAAALEKLRALALAEWWLIAAVIVATAVMTALYSPS